MTGRAYLPDITPFNPQVVSLSQLERLLAYNVRWNMSHQTAYAEMLVKLAEVRANDKVK